MELEPLPPQQPDPTVPMPSAVAPGAPPAPDPRSRPSRRVMVALGTLVVLAAGGLGLAAGATIGSHASTVRFQTAAAPAPGTTPTTAARGRRPILARRGVAGTVDKVTGGSTFTVSPRIRHVRTGGSPGTTPTTPAPPATTVTVTTTSATTYTETMKGSAADAKVGMRVAARGSRDASGHLAATRLWIGPARTPTTAPSASRPTLPPGAASRLEKAPFVAGTVSSNTAANGTDTIVVSTPIGSQTITTTSATGVVETVPVSFAAVKAGLRVLVVGTRSADGTSVAASAVHLVAAGTAVGGPGPFGGAGGLGKLGRRGRGMCAGARSGGAQRHGWTVRPGAAGNSPAGAAGNSPAGAAGSNPAVGGTGTA